MAPEILDGTISFTKFDAYKMVDIYSFGLIIWEIARRTSMAVKSKDTSTSYNHPRLNSDHFPGNRAVEYQLPYYQFVSHDPSMEDMRKVVCTENVRPPLESWWNSEEVLTYYT